MKSLFDLIRFLLVLSAFGLIPHLVLAEDAPLKLTIDATAEGKPISPDLIGVFYEDLSYAADGGLYAELIQNRSFEFGPADHEGWNALTGWDVIKPEEGRARVIIDTGLPIDPNNPHYAVLGVAAAGETVGLRNYGYDGIALKAGAAYGFSAFAIQLADAPGPLRVALEDADGEVLAETTLPPATGRWEKYEATLTPDADCDDARLIVTASHPGRLGLDMVSLFPADTFRGHPNGLRPDLAQAVADLKPRFVRFPGGCLVHGDGLDNIYHWKHTVGPVERRKTQRNIWNYHQSFGLGYYEYFRWCEDMDAEPMPIVAAGVTCQNSGAGVSRRWGQGQRAIPTEDMPAYVQDVLDLIEFANGPTDSKWGAVRAEMGHPEPFGLKYLGVGNEDRITDEFAERFEMIFDAVREKHPEVTVIGTSGPWPDGEDYDRGWALIRQLGVALVDEHSYKPPQWFWDNLDRFDDHDRDGAKVYLGEWAAHDDGRRPTLRAALAEAAYLTSLERNGDVVVMSSYAPLFAKRGHTHWNPDLIYFDNQRFYPTISYHVQKLFGHHAGDEYLGQVDGVDVAQTQLASSVVRDRQTGDVIIKLVNAEPDAAAVDVTLAGADGFAGEATLLTLAGDDLDRTNAAGAPDPVLPEETRVSVDEHFSLTLPPHSFSVVRLHRPPGVH